MLKAQVKWAIEEECGAATGAAIGRSSGRICVTAGLLGAAWASGAAAIENCTSTYNRKMTMSRNYKGRLV